MRRVLKIFYLVVILCIFANSAFGQETVRQWEVFEIDLNARKTYDNPYMDCLTDDGAPLVTVTFTGTSGDAKGTTITIPGFWYGGTVWNARFAPPAPGVWKYSSKSNDPGLDGAKGTLNCTAWTDDEKSAVPTRRGLVRVRAAGRNAGHYFEYTDGTPFLWIGDTWWNWTKRGTHLASFQKIVDDRVEKGFTIGQLFLAANGWGRQSSLLDESFTNLDTDHMKNIDAMIEYANAKGLTVWIHGWWSRENMDERIGAEKMRRWWRYLVHRYSAYNVVWVLAGEYNMYNYGGMGLDFWKDLGQMVDSEDPYERIIGTHTTPPAWGGGADAPQWSTGEVIHNETWLDYNQSQVGHGKWRNEMIPFIIADDYARTPAKPTVVTEPWYEFILDDPKGEDIRMGAWSAMCSGAAGHSYAGGHVWKAHVPEAPSGADTWPMDLGFETDTLDYPGAQSMGHMAKFFSGIEWWELAPHPECVLEYSDKYCLADPGREYVVYARWGGAPKIDLSPSTDADSFSFTWFNPRTGEEESTGTISGGENQYFHSPQGYPGTPGYCDWVLYIKIAE